MQSLLSVGDTVDFTQSLPGYPAGSGWVLSYRLAPKVSGSAITFSGTASGDDHRVVVSAATTAGWAPGAYTWASWVQHGDGRTATIGTGSTTLAPNPRTMAAGVDLRSAAQVALDAALAALAAWTPTTKRYSINGREMEFNSPAEIERVVAFWRNEVAREQATAAKAAGQRTQRKTFVRLGRA